MSVRGERVIYRERDRSRETERDPDRRSYTTVKRYQVPDRNWGEEDKVDYDKIIVKRERRDDPPPKPRTEIDFRVTERDRRDDDWHVTERVTEREPPRREIPYRVLERDHNHGSRSNFYFSERDRETVRAPSPPTQDRIREFRFERERSFSPPHHHHHHHEDRGPEIERYRKETEYYQAPAPQPIIIRESAPQAPIIIREERREPQQIIIRRDEPNYDFVEKEEVRDERQSLVRREEPPAPVPVPVPAPAPAPSVKPQDEDYFYERRIREVDRGRHREDEIRPKDSASQYGSDDSYEYVRRERIVEGDSRETSRHRRRDLAGGALAGIAGAQILRSHRKSQGRDPGGRGRSLVGGAAVGALGAEAVRRAKSWRRGSGSRSRSWSRSRSRSGSREPRRRRRHHHHSKSRSKSRAKQLGGLAAVAAVGALAGYALKNRGKNNETVIINDRPRRSRSRRRRGSVDTATTGYFSDGGTRRSESKHRDPEHRNRRIAQAGLASAAAAGIWERVRSKSRGGKSRSRSKSRIRQGVPIAAAGLGGAALAGLYEKTKAGKEAKKQAIIDDELSRGRRPSRSRSRSRSVPAPYPVNGRRGVDEDPMIAYGGDPIYPDRGGRGYYSDEEPGMYRRRHRGSSSGSSPDTRRRSRSRSKSRRRQLAGAGLAAGAAGAAGYAYNKHKERGRSASRERGKSRSISNAHENRSLTFTGHDDDYSEPYTPDEYAPPHDSVGYDQPQAAYPGGNYFPPPPTDPGYNHPADPYPQQEGNYNPYPAYNPAEYPPESSHTPYEQTRGAYGDSDATLGAPYPNDTFAGDPRYAAPNDAPAARGREDSRDRDGHRGRDPGNVSGNDPSTATNVAREDRESSSVDEDRETRRDAGTSGP